MAKLLYLYNKYLACDMCIFHSYFCISVLYFSLKIREFFSYFFMPTVLRARCRRRLLIRLCIA